MNFKKEAELQVKVLILTVLLSLVAALIGPCIVGMLR